MKIAVVAILAASLASTAGHAAVKPHALFSGGAVLQQGIEAPVWGTAADGEKVTVKFQDQEVAAVARDGRWSVRLKPLKPGGPFTMTVTGENTIRVNDLLVGEVWVCGGQSNMRFPLRQATGGPAAIAACADPLLRLLTVPDGAREEGKDEPARDLAVRWKDCDGTNAAAFSAVAYFFGRDLRRALNVPVGLIHASFGGTGVQFWMSWRAIEADPDFRDWVEARDRNARAYEAALAKYREDEPGLMAQWQAATNKAILEGKAPPAKPMPPRRTTVVIGNLYNGMIAPLQPYAIRGVIWFQGEANSTAASAYPKMFLGMIRGWRRDWGIGDFPFLFAQLGPFVTPEIREAQSISWQRSTNTAMVVSVDCSEGAREVHFPNKEPVGARLALAARAVAYGEKVEYSGPIFDSMQVEDGRAILKFQHAETGLVAKDGELKGFTIAGADAKFEPAQARIESDRVIVTCSNVPKPSAIRYGWTNAPHVNLCNGAGLPASPFRTDLPAGLYRGR